MNLLITGGAGFIGSHFVLRHSEHFPSDRIVVLDKLTYAADRTFLDPVSEKITFIHGDIVDVNLMAKVIAEHNIDVIVNFAAETHVDRSIENATPFLHTNVIGVQSILEVCRVAPKVRLMHISTDEVYGDLKDGERAKNISDVLHPSSPYAATKAAGEMLVLSAMRTYGVRAAITRCTNNYGPHQAQEKFLPTVIRRALANQPIPVYGNGGNKRDWLFVTDHTDALELILATDWAFFDPEIGCGHIFNISANEERRNIDVAKTLLKILGKPESLITFVKDRPGHDWRYALDSTSMRKLGWAPQVNFEDGLKQTAAWYSRRPALV